MQTGYEPPVFVCWSGGDFLNETVKDYLHIITQNDGEAVTYLLKEYDIAADRAIENEGKSLSVGQRKKLLIMKMLLRIEEASV